MNSEKILIYNLYQAFRDKVVMCYDVVDLGRLYNIIIQIFDSYPHDKHCIHIRDKLLSMSMVVSQDILLYHIYTLSYEIYAAVLNNTDLMNDLDLLLDYDIKVLRNTTDTSMII